MDSQSAVRARITVARLVETLERQQLDLETHLDELRAATADEPLPSTRDMILEALQYAAPGGLSRSEIGDAIRRDYEADVSVNTLTGTLTRMHAARTLRRVGQTWFLAK
jgi:hypothetical protein